MKFSDFLLKPIEMLTIFRERAAYHYALNKINSGNPYDFTREHLERSMKFMKSSKRYRSASKAYRNYLAKVYKHLRVLVPVIPQDYSKAKAEYLKFVAEGGITSIYDVKIGDWVTCIRVGLSNLPVKGKTYVSYYLNGSSSGPLGGAFKIDTIYESTGTVCGRIGDEHAGFSLGQFRLSTPEEIKGAPKFAAKIKIANLEEEIEGKHRLIKNTTKEISKIEKEITKLKKSL